METADERVVIPAPVEVPGRINNKRYPVHALSEGQAAAAYMATRAEAFQKQDVDAMAALANYAVAVQILDRLDRIAGLLAVRAE